MDKLTKDKMPTANKGLAQLAHVCRPPVAPNAPSPQTSYAIGDEKLGGIVFSVSQNGEHGLVAAKEDLDGRLTWSEAQNRCFELVVDGYDDWYLPSRGELNLIYWNLRKCGLGGFAADWYWSSTELDYFHAWCQYFDDGIQDLSGKDFDSKHVRAVRAF